MRGESLRRNDTYGVIPEVHKHDDNWQPTLHSGKGVTHDCASILDSIAKGTSCFHHFCIVHPYIAIHSVE